MYKEFTAKTLEEAYEKATSDLNCSITQLDIEIIQTQSKGIFGLFAKDAIISVELKQNTENKQNKTNKTKQTNTKKVKKIPTNENNTQKVQENQSSIKKEKDRSQKGQKIFNDFYSKGDVKNIHSNITIKKDEKLIIEEIEEKINSLFGHVCYKLDSIKVSFYDEETIYIEFKGEDAALLIGKEGYRYKALSYILFNWIHETYNLMLRLEVAEFLATQEEAIYNYLIPVIENINENGFYKTKPLDGVLVHIALKKLRDEFPQKYVAVKTNVKGDKYILVNEYRK